MTISQSAIARVVGIDVNYKDLRAGGILFLKQRVALIGQGSSLSTYATTKIQLSNAGEAAAIFGYGSPIHLAMRQLFPANGDGVGTIPVTIYPLEDDGSGVASAGDITPVVVQTEAASYKVIVNNIESKSFVIPLSPAPTVASVITSMAAAINAVLEMPVIAEDATPGSSTELSLTSKWKGESANGIYVEVEGSATAGTTFAVTQLTGGLVNPDISDALAQMGDIWETMVLNCLNIEDTTTLDLLQTFGEGRWGELVKKPLVAFTGIKETTVANATAVSDARKTDRTNGQLVEPGGVDLPCVIAARELARIVVIANNKPANDYGSQQATGLTPGVDGDQWDYLKQDQAVKAGSSTINVKDGVVVLADTITFYHPTGEEIPPYRYICDIVKLQNVIFNINLEFENPKWDGAPLIPDDQPTVNPDAKKPKSAIGAMSGIIDGLALNALISDPETAKKNTTASISSTNPKRLDVNTVIQLSGNTNIIPIGLDFGFFFGTQQIV